MAKSVQAGTIYTPIVTRVDTMDAGLREGGKKAEKGGRDMAAQLLRGLERIGTSIAKIVERALDRAGATGRTRARKSGEDSGRAFEEGFRSTFTRSGDKVAERYARVVAEGLRRRQAEIKEAQKRGLMTPAEAARAGREAIEAHNAAILKGMDRLRTMKTTGRGVTTPMTGAGTTALANQLVMSPGAGNPTRSGEEVAKRFVDAARRKLDAEMGRIKAAASAGLMTSADAEKKGKAAGEAYNRSLQGAMKKMDAQGRLSNGAASTFGNSLVDAKKMGSEAASVVESTTSRARAALTKLAAGFAVVLVGIGALKTGFSALMGTLDDAEALIRAQLRLAAAGRLLGLDQSKVNALAREARQEYKLSSTAAAELAVNVMKLAAQSGQAGKASELMARALDLGAAQGMSANEVAIALDQTLRGLDEGTDKLLQLNPSQIYETYAKGLGKTAAKLSDVEKKQALVNAVMEGGAKVQGAYAALVNSDIGRWQNFKTRMSEVAAEIGVKFLPVLVKAAETLERALKPAIETIINWLDRFQSPLQRSISALRELGRTAAEVLPLELRAQLLEKDTEAARLRRQVQRARTYRQATGGRGFAGERGNTFELTSDNRSVYEIREEQRRFQAQLGSGTLTADQNERYQRNKEILELEEQLATVEADRSNIQNSMDSAEAVAAKARRVRELTHEWERNRDLMEQQGESIGLLGRQAALIEQINDARRAAGMPLVDSNGNEIVAETPGPTTTTDPEKVKKNVQSARDQLDALISNLRTLSEFKDAAGQPFRSFEEVPGRLRGAIQAIVAVEDQIRDTRAQINEAESPERAAALRDYLASLEAIAQQRRTYAQQVREEMAARGELITEEALQARESMNATTAAFRELRALGIGADEEAPQLVVSMVDSLTNLDSQIKETRDQLATLRREGQTPTEADTRFLAGLEEDRAELAGILATLSSVRGILKDLPNVGAELFKGLDGTERDQLGQTLSVIAVRTQAVTEAEQALWETRQRHGPKSRQAREAERALTRSREDARRAVLALMSSIRQSNMSDEEKVRIVAFLRAQLEGLSGEITETASKWEKWGGTAERVAAITRSIGQLGAEIGALSEEQAKAIEGFAQMAEGAAMVAKAVATKDPAAAVAGAAALISGGVELGRSLFGDSAGARASRQAMFDLRDALRSLEEAILQDVSTNELRDDADDAARAARALGNDDETTSSYGPTRRGALADLAVTMGLAEGDASKAAKIDALKRWAEEMDAKYGTNLVSFIENSDARGLMDALAALSQTLRGELGELGKFADDFPGILERIRFEFDALGNTNVVERLRAIVAALESAGISTGEFSDELAELSTLDLDTAAGQARRDEIIAAMVRRLAEGGADLGDLTAEQLRELILEWANADNDDGESTGGGAVGGEETPEQHLSIGITELQANVLLEIQNSQLDELRMIRAAVAGGMPVALPMPSAPMLPSPTPPQDATFGAGVTFNLDLPPGAIVVNINPPANTPASAYPALARAGGEQVAGGLTARLRRSLRAQGATDGLSILTDAPGT